MSQRETIRRILREETSMVLREKILKMFKTIGLEKTSNVFGGIDGLFKILNVNSPMDYLHLFDDLDIVDSEENSDYTLYRYQSGYNIMVYSTEFGRHAMINWDTIWGVLWGHFRLNQDEIQKLTMKWISDVYDLHDVNTIDLRNDDIIETL